MLLEAVDNCRGLEYVDIDIPTLFFLPTLQYCHWRNNMRYDVRRSSLFSLLILILVVALNTAPVKLLGQELTTVLVDHSENRVFIAKGRERIEVNGRTVALSTSDTVVIKVTHTNSALYDYAASSTLTPSSTAIQLQEFLVAFRPYVLELGNLAFSAIAQQKARGSSEEESTGAIYSAFDKRVQSLEARATLDLAKPSEQVIAEMKKINNLAFYDQNSLRVVYLKTLQALRSMNLGDDQTFDVVQRDYRDYVEEASVFQVTNGRSLRRLSAGLVFPGCLKRLNDQIGRMVNAASEMKAAVRVLKQDLAKAIDEARRKGGNSFADSLSQFQNRFSDIENSISTAEQMVPEGTRALEDSGRLLQTSSDVELMALAAYTASSEIEIARIVPRAELDNEINLRVSPNRIAQLVGFGNESTREYQVVIRYSWPVRPALGIALFCWTGPYFSHYAVRQNGAQYEITQSRDDISRFNYALTLGLTYPGLDGRSTSGFALWLPEIIFDPIDKQSTLGVGAALSWKIFKVSVGFVWQKHTELDGQFVGQIFQDRPELTTQTTYGGITAGAKPYIGISIIGWMPR